MNPFTAPPEKKATQKSSANLHLEAIYIKASPSSAEGFLPASKQLRRSVPIRLVRLSNGFGFSTSKHYMLHAGSLFFIFGRVET
jgi:hypothetical protein